MGAKFSCEYVNSPHGCEALVVGVYGMPSEAEDGSSDAGPTSHVARVEVSATGRAGAVIFCDLGAVETASSASN